MCVLDTVLGTSLTVIKNLHKCSLTYCCAMKTTQVKHSTFL